MLDRPEAFRPSLSRSSLLPLQTLGLARDEGGKRLLGPIDLTLRDPGITVVMGPNGAGKSLLLRLLHGLIAPSAGEIRYAGEPMSEALRRRQAMVFQRPVLLRRSVAANIDFALELRGKASAARRQEVLHLAGLADRGGAPARRLSAGEQQRLALARALALEPEILFLDEPTANLDPASTLAIEGLVRAASHNGAKIVMVTHDAGQAQRIADEAVFVHKGSIVEQTPAAVFFSEPSSREARDYLAGRIVL